MSYLRNPDEESLGTVTFTKSALSVLSGKILMAFMAQSSGTSLSIEAGMHELSGWLNSRPLDPQSSALPSCAIARCY